MKRSRKQLSSKANFRTFCYLIALVLGQNSVKGFRVTKNVEGIKVEGVWNELEYNNVFRNSNSQNI